ncbi:hypothetical protein CGMCC3_g17825 [Colletotrichum fructicola]|nr:uncharacterized protein CGMCC3_g17825 [Colletotrichum fructicola]KAE9565998.1 hypothetical protein CGMCC3_g17825 [Colletotrichum fructicola]
MIDTVGTLGKYSDFEEEREFAALGGIKYEQIVSWRTLNSRDLRKSTPNKDFDKRKYGSAVAGGVQYKLAGFPLDHKAWREEPWKKHKPTKRDIEKGSDPNLGFTEREKENEEKVKREKPFHITHTSIFGEERFNQFLANMTLPSPLPSSPPSRPTAPHSLTDKQRRRLEALQLHINEPEPVLICRPCGYALKPFGERVSRHLAEKHEVPKPQRRGLSALVKSLHLGDPNDVALRPDGLPPHETLTVTRGHACRRCSYRTASDDLICRHIAKSHGIKGLRKTDGWQRDHIHSGVLLQSWSQNGARGFWIAQPTAAGSTPPRETGSPDADDVPAAQHALLAAAHDAERAHLAGGVRATASATGPVDIAFQTGWMRRTGWDLMFDGARRDFLVKMSELPDAGRHVEDDMPHASPPRGRSPATTYRVSRRRRLQPLRGYDTFHGCLHALLAPQHGASPPV